MFTKCGRRAHVLVTDPAGMPQTHTHRYRGGSYCYYLFVVLTRQLWHFQSTPCPSRNLPLASWLKDPAAVAPLKTEFEMQIPALSGPTRPENCQLLVQQIIKIYYMSHSRLAAKAREFAAPQAAHVSDMPHTTPPTSHLTIQNTHTHTHFHSC